MKNKRLLSLGLTAVLIISVCGCGKSAETMEETEEKKAEAAEITEKAARRSAREDAEKEETVYVNADASGNVQNITVSSWLKNTAGAAEITDVTDLTDVVNVKGDEPFTQDGDTYVWSADGNDIYYQGKTSKELPVNVKVTYYLDGAKIAPGELAGKSGQVKIRFDYENVTARQALIGEEETELCVPFAAVSTMILDSDKFVNVEAENGKILSDGKNTIVSGVAMPGLYDSLDLMNLEGFEDIDIPEYVEVTADVTEFELSMTATILMPDVFGSLNTDDMDGFDDLKADIEELNDATYELIDGCMELDDGVKELKDHMPDLQDGVAELDDGAVELDDGARELNDGAGKLNDGAKDIRDGAKELDKGAGALQAGAGLLNERIPELTGGVNALAAGIQSVLTPMTLGPDGQSGDAEHPYIKTSVSQLKRGVDSLAALVSGSSMGDSLAQTIADNQKKMQEAQERVGSLQAQLTAAAEEAQALQEELSQKSTAGGQISEPEAAVFADYQAVVELQTKLILKLNEVTELQNQLREAVAAYAALKGAGEALNQIAASLSAGADAGQLAQLTEGMAALETSVGQIYDGIALINSQMGTLTKGAAELSQGIGALKDGTDTLKDGTGKLCRGGIELREGTEELYDGTQELKDGTQELKDGTAELKDGVADLADGVDELKDGTTELLDGVHEYNDDGIQKLYDAVTVDLQNLLDRVDAIADLSGDYQSFSGKSDIIKGSVKFIIETEAIGLDEE